MSKRKTGGMINEKIRKTINRKLKSTAAAAMFAAALAAAPLSVTAEEAGSVRVGSILALGTATPFVAQELGYYEEAGLEVEVAEFADGAALMEAFAAGELDVAMVGIGPAATWFTKGST